MKIEIFVGKGIIVKIFLGVWNFSRNRGEIWNRGEMHHCLRGMDRRLCLNAIHYKIIAYLLIL